MNIAELSLVKSAKKAGWRRCARAGASVAIAAQLAWSPLMAAGTPGSADAGATSVSVSTATSGAGTAAAAGKTPDAILKVMQSELTRATEGLAKSEPAPYYISYTVNDQDIVLLVGA